MSDTETEQEVIQEQTQEQAPVVEAPAPQPQDGFEARLAASEAEKKQLREDLQRAAQAMAQLAITQPAHQAPVQQRQAPAPDPLDALKDQASPEVIAAINAKFAQVQAQFQQQLVQVRGQSNQQVLSAKAAQFGPAVQQLAERAFAEEVNKGYDPAPDTVLDWALGKALREGTYVPGAPAQRQVAPAQKPTLAPQAPVMSGVAPAPRVRGTINPSLSGAEYVAAVEAAGLDDFPI